MKTLTAAAFLLTSNLSFADVLDSTFKGKSDGERVRIAFAQNNQGRVLSTMTIGHFGNTRVRVEFLRCEASTLSTLCKVINADGEVDQPLSYEFVSNDRVIAKMLDGRSILAKLVEE